MVREIPSSHGYRILDACCGKEALAILKEHPAQIQLLLTDVVMPNMSGKELAESAKNLHQGSRVLYMSGYTDNAIVHHGVLDHGARLLQKPFSPVALLQKVRAALGKAA